MPQPSVIRARAVLAERGFGMKVGEALFSDGLTARFRVLSHSPPSVRAVADEPLPEHEKAVETWLEKHTSARGLEDGFPASSVS